AKIASGALEYVKVAEVNNLVNTLKMLKEHGYWIVGSDGSATRMYTDIDYDMNTVLIIGSEGKGISRLVREECDFIVKLPMKGHVTSLNASVAAGILLYNIERSRT
ncbi:MAG: RNA methyltransferase, partial [Erysipelotrichaceae bacterium]|nr:RNA methyltransferase [Erysipelotrichaceae bacterium]